MASSVWMREDLQNILLALAASGLAAAPSEDYATGYAAALSAMALALGVKPPEQPPFIVVVQRNVPRLTGG